MVTMKVGDAVDNGIIANETLGYFVARVGLFLRSIGARRLRFRQVCGKFLMGTYYLNNVGWSEMETQNGLLKFTKIRVFITF